MVLRLIAFLRLIALATNHLSKRHYLMIAVNMVAPMAFSVIMAYFAIECLWVRLAIVLAALLVWPVFVVVVVAMLVERDTGDVTRSLGERVDPLEERIGRLHEEHSGLIQDLQSEVEDLENRTRTALQSIGVDLAPGAVRLRASARSGIPTASFTLRISGGSRWARLRASLRRWRRRIWEIVWG